MLYFNHMSSQLGCPASCGVGGAQLQITGCIASPARGERVWCICHTQLYAICKIANIFLGRQISLFIIIIGERAHAHFSWRNVFLILVTRTESSWTSNTCRRYSCMISKYIMASYHSYSFYRHAGSLELSGRWDQGSQVLISSCSISHILPFIILVIALLGAGIARL